MSGLILGLAINAAFEGDPTHDIQITDHGSIVGFRGLSEAGTAFLRDEVVSEGWQWLGDSLNVDHRLADDLADGIADAGLIITRLG